MHTNPFEKIKKKLIKFLTKNDYIFNLKILSFKSNIIYIKSTQLND